MFVIAVTGWRGWGDFRYVMQYLASKDAALQYKDPALELSWRVGDCPTGVDTYTRDWLALNELDHEVYRADWDRYGKAAGPIRNRTMLLGHGGKKPADLLLAFPAPGSYPYKGSGTWNCIGQAWELGIRTELCASLGPTRNVTNLASGEPSPRSPGG